MKSSNIPYLPQVDHLRALAAVWIVLYHGRHWINAGLLGLAAPRPGETTNPFYSLVIEGHTAVALFMVLSGFIFTHGALGKQVRYAPFVFNRFLRIYPLYVAVAAWLIAARSSAGVQTTVESVLVTVLPLANMKWANTSEVVPLSWAVAVEFQFYLIFPVLMARFNERPLRVAGGVIATAFLLRVLAVINNADPRDLSYWTIVGRIDQFVLGMVAAVAYARLGRGVALGTFAASVPLTVAALFTFHRLGGWDDQGWWKVVWPTVEGLVWAAFVFGYVGSGLLARGWVSRGLVLIGEASFSIYLLHQAFVFPVARHVYSFPLTGIDPGIDALLLAAFVVLPGVLVLSLITYRVVERPFLALRRKYLVEPVTPPPEAG